MMHMYIWPIKFSRENDDRTIHLPSRDLIMPVGTRQIAVDSRGRRFKVHYMRDSSRIESAYLRSMDEYLAFISDIFTDRKTSHARTKEYFEMDLRFSESCTLGETQLILPRNAVRATLERRNVKGDEASCVEVYLSGGKPTFAWNFGSEHYKEIQKFLGRHAAKRHA